jgi:hypothetical protein
VNVLMARIDGYLSEKENDGEIFELAPLLLTFSISRRCLSIKNPEGPRLVSHHLKP